MANYLVNQLFFYCINRPYQWLWSFRIATTSNTRHGSSINVIGITSPSVGSYDCNALGKATPNDLSWRYSLYLLAIFVSIAISPDGSSISCQNLLLRETA